MIGSRSFMAKREEVQRKWYVVDAAELPLGRLAVKVARVLMGKHKPTYTSHVDCGDFVVVINADKVLLTGRKAQRSMVHRYTGYSGGLKSVPMGEMLKQQPERLFERVVKGMLPKSVLGRSMFRKLKVYRGTAHPLAAQKPETMDA